MAPRRDFCFPWRVEKLAESQRMAWDKLLKQEVIEGW